MTDANERGAISLSGRLSLLAETGVITPTARALTEAAIRRISAQFGPLDDEDGAPLATHIAMALTRVERGAPDSDLPDIAGAELAERPDDVAFARELAGAWEAALGTPIPEGEVSYVALHVAAHRETSR